MFIIMFPPILAVIGTTALITMILGTLYGGGSLVNQFMKQRGQEELGRAELAMRGEQTTAGHKATKMGFQMQREMTREQWERLGSFRKEDRTERREDRRESRTQRSEDRQLAMMLQAIQSISGAARGGMPQSQPASIVDLLRR